MFNLSNTNILLCVTGSIAAYKSAEIIRLFKKDAAAHKVSLNDIVIICTYGEFNEAESAKHKPTLVYFDKENNITGIKNSIPKQKLHSV